MLNLGLNSAKFMTKGLNNSNPVDDQEHVDDLPKLPETLSICFADDELVLRKLFARSIHRECPGWQVDEAASGERALQVVGEKYYDLVFLDQYMTSSAKKLLGSETSHEF